VKFKIASYFSQCSFCGDAFLVQLANNGSNHVMNVVVMCKKCLKLNGLNEEYKKQYPEDAEKIKRWLETK
jgi:hypothetical protein